MERKYQLCKELADALCDRIKEENLPIEAHVGDESVDCHGDVQVDVLLVYDNPELVNIVLTDLINETFNLV